MSCRYFAPRVLFASILTCFVVLPIVADDRKDDDAALKKLAADFEATHNKHDAAAFAALFAPDADFTNVVGMTAHGRQAIEAFHRPLFEGDTSRGNPSFKNAVLKIDEVKTRFLRPDVASTDIRWTQTGSVAPDGRDRGTRKGLASWVATKDHGVWRVAVMHNMDLLPVTR